MAINFFVENIEFDLKEKIKVKKWINNMVSSESKKVGELNYIFCSDDYILNINREYLAHDYFTDIITFNYNVGKIISGDIFISIDTVKSNAEKFSNQFNDELHRVIIHGALHLVGFDDTTSQLKLEMTEKEDYYLLQFI